MFTSIWEDIKREFNYGNTVSRIILVNIGVFLLINIVWVILRISNGWVTPPAYEKIVQFLSISSSVRHNLTHIWVFITHMFLHGGFWHLLSNLVFLVPFGVTVERRLGHLATLVVFACAAAAYSALAWAGFVWDDRPLVLDNTLTGELTNLPRFFAVDLWRTAGSAPHDSGYYRPLMLTSLALDRSLWGLSAAGRWLVDGMSTRRGRL